METQHSIEIKSILFKVADLFDQDSLDEDQLKVLDDISGNEATSDINEYTYSVFKDHGKYYRLSQTDFDGTHEKLATIFASCNTQGEDQLFTYTKVDNVLEINSLDMQSGMVLTVVDATGRLVFEGRYHNGAPERELIYLNQSTGIYLISLSSHDTITIHSEKISW